MDVAVNEAALRADPLSLQTGGVVAADDLDNADTLFGGEGNDVIYMGEDDIATGGDGADVLIGGAWNEAGEAPDITDFVSGDDSFVYLVSAGSTLPTMSVNDLGGNDFEILADGVVVATASGPLALSDVSVANFLPA